MVGSLPGLSATMATALLVPVTFYLSPIAAVATIISASAMAIFSGDIPGALLRIPGTPASAAYTDEAYAMTRKGQPEMALGIGLWFSALGGIAGTLSLMVLAPPLAEMALNFSTYEYFWLAFLGLMCATLVARSSPVKAIASMLIGLLVACIGIENPAGTPRFTFGSTDLLGGIEPIPALVGVFAVSEVMRAMLTAEPPKLPYRRFGSILAGQLALTKQVRGAAGARQHRRHHHRRAAGRRRRHGGLGQLFDVEALLQGRPRSSAPAIPEGLIEAGASNNASLASGWVPSLLFGIPGDTITAIAIGVLYMKGLNPGPTLFTERASSMYALYIIFIIANIIMIPLGIVMIRVASTGAARAARGRDAGDRPALRGRRVRDRQQPVRRHHRRRLRRHRLRHGAQRLSGRRHGARHRHGHHGGAELRDLAHQVGRQHPAVLQPAGGRRAGRHDHRRPAVAGGRLAARPAAQAASLGCPVAVDERRSEKEREPLRRAP